MKSSVVFLVVLSFTFAALRGVAQTPLLPVPIEVKISPGPFIVLPAEAESVVKQLAREGDLLEPAEPGKEDSVQPAATLVIASVEAELGQLEMRIALIDEALKAEGFAQVRESIPGEAPMEPQALSNSARAALSAIGGLSTADASDLRVDLLHPATPTPPDVIVTLTAIRNSQPSLASLSDELVRQALIEASTADLRKLLPRFVYVDGGRRRAVRPNAPDVLDLEVPSLTEPSYAIEALDTLIGYWTMVRDYELYDSQDRRFLASLTISALLASSSTPPIDRLLADLEKARLAVAAQTRLIDALRAMSLVVPWDCASRPQSALWASVFSPAAPLPPRFTNLTATEKDQILTFVCTIKTVIKDDSQSDLLAEWYSVSRRRYRLDFRGTHFKMTEDRTGEPIGTLEFEPIDFGPFTAPMNLLWAKTALLSPGGLQTANPYLFAYRANEFRSAISSTLVAPAEFLPSTRMEYQKQLLAQRTQLEVEQRILARQQWREGRELLASLERLRADYRKGRIWAPEAAEVTVRQVDPEVQVSAGQAILTAVPARRRAGTFRLPGGSPIARFLVPGEQLEFRLVPMVGPNLSFQQIVRILEAPNSAQLRTVLRNLFQQYGVRHPFQARVIALRSDTESENLIVEVDLDLASSQARNYEYLTVSTSGAAGLSADAVKALLQDAGLWEATPAGGGVPLAAGSLKRGETYAGQLTLSRPEALNRFLRFAESLTW